MEGAKGLGITEAKTLVTVCCGAHYTYHLPFGVHGDAGGEFQVIA